jgi:DNA replication protein DnaC
MTIPLPETEIPKLARKLSLMAIADYKKHVTAEMSFEEALYQLLLIEDDMKEMEKTRRRIKYAGFPISKTLDTFKFDNTRLPYLKKEQVLELATCEYIKNRNNVIAVGNSGTGKTHMAIALGLEAIRMGYSVKFRRASDLVNQLSEAHNERGLMRFIKTINNCHLLIIDELGYLTLDQKSSNLLFQVFAGRYEVRSTIVTSNMEFSKWPEFIGDPVMATALVDRLVHMATLLNMNGESYRLSSSKK